MKKLNIEREVECVSKFTLFRGIPSYLYIGLEKGLFFTPKIEDSS